MTDIVNGLFCAIERIGFLLTNKSNPSELREKEAIVKKLLRTSVPLDILRLCPFKRDSIELLILVQIIGRNSAVSAVEVPDRFVVLLLEIVRAPETLRPTRLQILKIVAILIVRFIRPSSILAFVNSLQEISDCDRLYMLTEMVVFDGAVKSTDIRELLASYGSELLPVLLRPHTVDVLEKWLDYIPTSRLVQSPIFTLPLSFSDCVGLEEVLVKCCTRPMLKDKLFQSACMLLNSDKIDHQLVGLRMLSGICKDALIPTTIISRIVHLIQNVPTSDISLYESVLCVIEESNVMTWEVFDLMLALSAFPRQIEIRYPCRHRKDYVNRQQMNEDDLNDVFRYQFFELREDARQCLRKSQLKLTPDQLLQRLQSVISSSSLEWQQLESVIHAIGAVGPRFDSLANQVSEILLSYVTVQSPRPIITVTVLALLAFSKSYDVEFFNSSVVRFVVNALASIDTIDYEFGWFDFRSKQDNCAVGFLHFISSDFFKGRIDSLAFSRLIANHMGFIKARIFIRDPFRQTRDIFVKSVSAIIVKNSNDPIELLRQTLTLICEDAADLANFVTPATAYKDGLWSVISPILTPSLLASRGGEVLVTTYAHKMDVDDILSLISEGLQTDLGRWIMVIPKICHVDKSRSFTQRVSPLLLFYPLTQIPSDWFTCVSQSADKDLQVKWVKQVLSSTVIADQVPAVSEFIALAAQNIPETRLAVIQGLISLAVKFPGHNEPIDELLRVYHFDKTVFVEKQSLIPEEEYRQFLSGLESGDTRKIRRFLKKFPNGIFQ
jgi:hypothetical protein